ncbi:MULTISPECIES: STAS domain-containing protein [unclassified Micromonospora]|uniref:STAS domain-containing protein n=1 Tax=unclassified Micromonospora TaxID=2617518 RepID=UPI000EF490B3|nr:MULTISPECIES: STAS domain-containing protein [unclassified Micromonospora]RLP86396.1 anti-sigma factor antagonist [Micromonospora sp. CV4]RLP93557.1 anti-sigma factor antagonist [Micromonospora sp. BL4]
MSTFKHPVRHQIRPAEPIMTLSLDTEGPLIVITVSGEIDMSNAHLITDLAEHGIGRRPARLVLDLSGVTFFSAHGISALLRVQSTAAHAQVELILRDAAPCVIAILTATGTLTSLCPGRGHRHGEQTARPVAQLAPRVSALSSV